MLFLDQFNGRSICDTSLLLTHFSLKSIMATVSVMWHGGMSEILTGRLNKPKKKKVPQWHNYIYIKKQWCINVSPKMWRNNDDTSYSCIFSSHSTCFRHLQSKVAEPKFIASGEHFFRIGFIWRAAEVLTSIPHQQISTTVNVSEALKQIGIDGELLELISDYLSDRKQKLL